jgi:hypothetical protein
MFRKLVLPVVCMALLVSPGCKKSNDEKPDYACNCGQYGRNLATFLLDRPLALVPFYDASEKWGFMDNSGKVIFPPKYHQAYRFSNNRALIVDNSTGKEFVGFLNEEGAMAIEPKYRFIASYFPKEGLLPVGNLQTWKIGFLARDGTLPIPYQYDLVGNFHEGMATVGYGGVQGAIDVHGTLQIPMDYNYIDFFSEGLAFAITPDGRHGYINMQNQFAVEGDFTEGGWFIDGLAWVNDPISHLYGFIRQDGSFLVEPKYQGTGCFWEGLAAVKSKGLWGFINNSGTVAISCQFEDVTSGFSEGLAAVMKEGKWGYIGTNGSFVIAPEFDDADVFVCGVAMVNYIDGTYGFINRQGKSVWRSTTGSLKPGRHSPGKLSDLEHLCHYGHNN